MPDRDIEEKRKYQREWIARRRAAWIATKGGACAECGSTKRIEIDHVDPAKKSVNAASLWSRTKAYREAELEKCQLLCRECHDLKSGREPAPHGSANRYQRHGCRCEACRGWNAARVRRHRSTN